MMGTEKEVFLGIIDFIVTKNEEDNVELKILEMGPYDTSGFDGINEKYQREGSPIIFDKVLGVLLEQFKNVYFDCGPCIVANSHKHWVNYDTCSDEPSSGLLPELQAIGENNKGFQLYDEGKCNEEGLLWLFPLSQGSGQCYAKAHRVNQKLRQSKNQIAVSMASLGSVSMTRNKGILKKIFELSPSILEPSTLLIDLSNIDEAKLQAFFQEANTEYFIIKPTNGTLAEGIFIAKKEDLKAAIQALKNKDFSALKLLLRKYQTPENSSENKLQNICNFWNKDENRFALLQAYCFAAPVQDKNKNIYYSSKGRAVFLVIDNKVHVIDIYFHAPVADRNSAFAYTQCVIGGNVNTVYFNPDEKLFVALKSIFNQELPAVFEKAFDFNLQTDLLEAIDKNDEAWMSYLLTSCATLPVGEPTQAYLDKIKENISTSPRGLLFLDFLVKQVGKYFLANEEGKLYHSFFVLLKPNISLLTASQINELLVQKTFALQTGHTKGLAEFFKELESCLEKCQKPKAFLQEILEKIIDTSLSSSISHGL